MSQRSIILFWLVAANICAIAIGASWSQSASGHGDLLFFALLSAQVSVVCIWCGLNSQMGWRRYLFPVIAVLVASLVFGAIDVGIDFFVLYYALQGTMVFASLWLLRRSRYWRRLTGAVVSWQFSIAQLFVLMTVVAVLISLLRASLSFGEEPFLIAMLLVSSVMLAVTAVIIWTIGVPWFLRLALICVTAVVLSIQFLVADLFLPSVQDLFRIVLYQLLTEAVVLAIWLDLGGILPTRQVNTISDASDATA